MINSREFRWGQSGELVVREWLKSEGFLVIATSNIVEGGAPMLRSHIESLILPDIQAFRGGQQLWFDVKTKARTPHYQKLNRLQTGCEMRHFEAYKQVANETGMPGALAFLQCDREELWIGSLRVLDIEKQPHPGFGQGSGHAFREPMAFFPLTAFDRHPIGDFEAFRQLKFQAVAPKTWRPWEPINTAVQHREIRKAVCQSRFDFDTPR